ncbi:MAG: RNA methyltransferase [Pirellulales bacterium]
MITSPQNPRIKEAVRLRDGRQRRKAGRFLIDGGREILRAFRAGIAPRELFVCEELCRTPESRTLLEFAGELTANGCELLPVSATIFAKLAYGDREDGVVAVVESRAESLRDLTSLKLPETPLVAVAAGVEKPGNLGAIARSADGAGVSALLAAGVGADLENPHAIRASLGTIFGLPCRATDEPAALAWLRERRLTIYAAMLDPAAVDYTQVDFRGPTAIVLGGEADGLGELWRVADVHPIRLPMLGAADSLNVSTAAAVLFYEALRQRTVR